MSSNKLPPNLMPAMYAWRIHDIATCARAHGYAIAVHGSMQNDLDLVAVPWTERAVTAEALVSALCTELGCHQSGTRGNPMPHGRVAYTLMMGGAAYMDLSIMPIGGQGPAA